MRASTESKNFAVLELTEEQENYVFGELDFVHSKMPAFPVVLDRYKTLLGVGLRNSTLDMGDPCVVDYYRILDAWRNREIVFHRS